MKRQTFILICILMTGLSQAAPVTMQDALQKARLFMKNKTFSNPSSIDKGNKVPHVADAPSYYVFNADQQSGFVIVAADDRMPDILGYAEQGSLDVERAPCNLKWLLSYYDLIVSQLDEGRLVPQLNNTTRPAIQPLVVTQWGQGTPYNDLCPQQSLTGCVATSMAQVINYNRWPQGETSAVEAYVSGRFQIEVPPLSPTRFNWDNMTPNDIARLMRYCGQSVKMDYGPNESGAFDSDIEDALINVFGYSKSTHLASRYNYEDEAWEQLVYQELSEGRPLIYNGEGPYGGHSFVVCGYENQLFYVNWGWDGECDGYFNLSILAPSNGTDFSLGQTAIVGMQPPAGQSDIARPKAVVQEISVSDKTLSRKSAEEAFPSFKVNSTIVSDLNDDATMQLGLGLYDDEGLRLVLSSTSYAFTENEAYSYEQEISLPSDLPQGEYAIKTINRMSDDDPWLSDAGSSDHYVSLVVELTTLRLQTLPKSPEDMYVEEYGIHTIDGITYRLVCEYTNFRAYILRKDATDYWGWNGGEYEGYIHVPDFVTYSNIHFTPYGECFAFSECSHLTSLSIKGAGIKLSLHNCSEIKSVELREGTVFLDDLYDCDSLETISFPSTLITIENSPREMASLREMRFLTTQQLTIKHMRGSDWGKGSMPELKDIYFESDFPPIVKEMSGKMEVNEDVTIHIPQGTLPLYQKSVWKDWNLQEDLASVPVYVIWDYSGNNFAINTGIGCGRGNNNVEFAIRVPASHMRAYKGCKVTKIEYHSETEYDNDFGNGNVEYVFITTPGVDYQVKQKCNNVRGTWNFVKLQQPYTITDDDFFVGFGRYHAVSSHWATKDIIDDGMYLRVMGTDTRWGMAQEIGVWQKHAGVDDWYHPLPIRFYIEGENLPTDVLISQVEFIANQSSQMQQPSYHPTVLSHPQGAHDEYFTYNIDKSTVVSAPQFKQTTNGQLQMQVSVRSRTLETIRKLSFDWMIDDKYQGNQSFDTYILPNHPDTLHIDLPDNINGRNHKIIVNVSDIDGKPDEIMINSCDTSAYAIPAKKHFPRRIVMEEATGTWCGWCPRGLETIKRAKAKYPDNFIAVALHGFDEMSLADGSYDDIINLLEYYPNGLINRTRIMDPDWDLLLPFINNQKDDGEAKIETSAIFTSADRSMVTCHTETTFGFDDDGSTEYRIAYVVLEDNVGPFVQTNYYSDPQSSNNPGDWMNEWIHKEYYVNMLFNDVTRAVFPTYKGTNNSMPSIIKEGEVYSQDYVFTLPENVQDKANLRIVTLLIDSFTGEILNAAQAHIDYDPSGIRSILAESQSYDVYTPMGVIVRQGITSLDELPRGIYIINGRKVVIR